MPNNPDKKAIVLPFIFLAKIYIRFYKGKNDFWIVLPSFILSLIISLNVYAIIDRFTKFNMLYIAGLYFLLYFILFFIFNKKFPDFKSVQEINLTLTDKIISVSILTLGILSFVILSNFFINK